MHFAEIWQALASEIPEAPALVSGDKVRTWSEFDRRSTALASSLAELGVTEGTTVSINLYNAPEYFEVFFAALKLGAVPANVNYRYVGHELSELLDQSGCKLLVYHSSLAQRVASALELLPSAPLLVEIDDIGAGPILSASVAYESLTTNPYSPPVLALDDSRYFLSYTGGTTGLPKGVMVQVERMTQVCLGLRAMATGVDIDPGSDPLLTVRELASRGQLPATVPAAPLMHSTGFSLASLPALVSGGCVATLPGRHFDADELFTTVAQVRPKSIAIVGDAFALPMIRSLQQAVDEARPYDVSSIISIMSAGVPWSAGAKQALLRFMPNAALSDACGSTEGAHYGSSRTRVGDAATSDRFVAASGVRVLDDNRRPLPLGEVGLLAAPTAAVGYFNDPAATDLRFFSIEGQRYVVPGDYGRIDGDGTLTLLGRGTSTINTGGEKVYPAEVEEVFRSLPGIEDCLVFGIADDRFGQRVCAIVQSVAGSTLEHTDLIATARHHLAGYKVPRLLLTHQIPRFVNGKPDYDRAKRLASQARSPALSDGGTDDVLILR